MKKKSLEILTFYTCTINDNHMYGSWNIERNRQFFVILDHFLPFSHPKNLKNFEKMRKKAGDIIILDMCTKNHDHMLYCFWDMPCDECNFHFLFWAIFGLFTSLTTLIIKIFKKWKKHYEISSLYNCAPKILITWYTVPNIWCMTDRMTEGQTNWRMDGWKK